MWRIAHGCGKMTYELQTRQKSEKGETAGKHKVLRGFTFQTAFLKKCLGPYYWAKDVQVSVGSIKPPPSLPRPMPQMLGLENTGNSRGNPIRMML